MADYTPEYTPQPRPAPTHRPADAPDLPAWPYPADAPMRAHRGTGQWYIRHAGRQHYFGRLDDPAGALAIYRVDWPAIVRGLSRPSRRITRTLRASLPTSPIRELQDTAEPSEATTPPDSPATPHAPPSPATSPAPSPAPSPSPAPPRPRGVQTADLIAAALADALARHEADDIGHHRVRAYASRARWLLDTLPASAGHISPAALAALARSVDHLAPVTRRCRLTDARVLLNSGCDLIGIPRFNFGHWLDGPPERAVRAARRVKGEQWYTRWECRRLIAAAAAPTPRQSAPADFLHACVLLGLNAAMGPSELSSLLASSVTLFDPGHTIDGIPAGGELAQPRQKTEIPRRCILWPETAAALRRLIGGPHHGPSLAAMRPRGVRLAAVQGLLLVAPGGVPICRGTTDWFGPAFRRLVQRSLSRPRGAAYWLRRTWRTVAAGAECPSHDHAVRVVMGHALGPGSSSMDDLYVQRIPQRSLAMLSDHVRRWVWPSVRLNKGPLTGHRPQGKKQHPPGPAR